MPDLTLEQVVDAGRYAVREVRREQDGLSVTELQLYLPLGPGRGATFAVAVVFASGEVGAIGPASVDELKGDGWHHLPGCDCEYCRG